MLSPSVTVSEVSETNFSVSGSTGSAGFVGHFEKGPVSQPTFITSKNELLEIFGRGVGEHHNDWYQVYNYLSYVGGIWVDRTCGDLRVNANNGSDVIIDNDHEWWNYIYDTIDATGAIRLISKTPGTWGNNISIGIIQEAEYTQNVLIGYGRYAQDVFTFFEPNYIGIVVFYNGLVVETFQKLESELEEISKESNFVYVKNGNLTEIITDNGLITDTGVVTDGGLITAPTTGVTDLGLISVVATTGGTFTAFDTTLIEFSNGASPTPTIGNFADNYDKFSNADVMDIAAFIGNVRAPELAIELGETRRDCMVFLGLPSVLTNGYVVPYKVTASSETQIFNYIDTLPRSMFTNYTANIKMQYDEFTNKRRQVDIAGDAAGLMMVATRKNPSGIGAGVNHGQIKFATSMFRKLNVAQNSEYHLIGVNTTSKNTIDSQFTFVTGASSFDRTNVRTLFNHLEKSVKSVTKYLVFGENTERSRELVRSSLTNALMVVKYNRGLEDAKVIVSIGENPNVMVIDIYVKPKYAAEFVNLRFTNAGTNEFKTVVQ